ncbi:hypothetical protein GCM10023144_19440 [Pigmentiphaga soli]|uniref:Uncharacterized protein n=1 Tax=Pigmentiphaga soli TaxID=1007095 RepID=A0ABP8GX09_9BURK
MTDTAGGAMWRRAAAAAMLAGWLAASPLPAAAEAAGPPVAPALAIPGVASSAQAFVPDGFVLLREAQGDLGGGVPGVAQVYENADGRRALLIGWRRPDGFEASGWGFVVPCRDCGIDLSGYDNYDVRIDGRAVVVEDRSASAEQGTRTDARLTLAYDAGLRRWRLATVSQATTFLRSGRAEHSFIDYLRGVSRDAVGKMEDGAFRPESVQEKPTPPQVLTLDGLALY